MKKHLLTTSAIALGVAAAAPASAQEWNLDWGGFMSQHVAFADVTDNTAVNDFDGVVFHSSTEIHFTPSITLDNGLTFGINVQFEGENGGGGADGIDETYMIISGDTLGRIEVGSENSAGYKSMVAAPGVTSMYINSPSISAFIPLSNALPWQFRQAGVSAYTEVGGNNDVDRISYYTPDFNGLTLGISYARNNGGNAVGSHNNNTVATLEDIWDIGAYYSQTFGTTSVTIGARYGIADAVAAGASDPETWGIGAQLGFGDFTVGAHYAENDQGSTPFAAGQVDQQSWSIGATYDAPGAWSFEALAFMGEYDIAAGDQEYNAYRIGASRDLGPGVDWDIYAIYAEADDKATAGTEVKGTVIGTAINLSF
ncbi:porin [Roseovarius sp. SCSIO 43702]|uniref:porin n=1 Tax=Roseovarius sp. SCSIO 43702 TaxID=2823043 RepID=UPI001C7345A5|nr:porin [Roseovarius sp. SCSIO 43702]QYX56216.1 porin [Roseovarius sp. SCSIO 43702]